MPWGACTSRHRHTAMHDMGSLGRSLQIDLPALWTGIRYVWRGLVSRAEVLVNTVCVEGAGQPVLRC